MDRRHFLAIGTAAATSVAFPTPMLAASRSAEQVRDYLLPAFWASLADVGLEGDLEVEDDWIIASAWKDKERPLAYGFLANRIDEAEFPKKFKVWNDYLFDVISRGYRGDEDHVPSLFV